MSLEYKTSNDLRQAFLDYFKRQGHEIVPSSSLVPAGDQTLLFTNAGMVQFKDTFLGTEQRSYNKATSSQRCVRAGGKHNDLENVGYTARHHTFFEMLGNFSFGDYFKREAIKFAWEFLTTVLKLPEERLWVTVYEEDDEAADIWLKEMQVSPERFSRCGKDDNFWQMGDTGPCGPCSEIFYDHGAHIPGGPPGSKDADLDRYIEIWNLVFMQYDRDADGQLTPLPKPSVDTGMGLERICAVMQGVHDNYDIDIFQTLLKDLAELLGQPSTEEKSMRVVCDHIRSSAFLIMDGVTPSNEGRGYVLRRIIRRAIRHGHKVGFTDAFFYRLLPNLVKVMGDAYPELAKQQARISDALKQEEEQFNKTLQQGLSILENSLAELNGTSIPGELAFKLYDTYGFPLDLTADIARERSLTVDTAGFERAMAAQRERSLQASQFKVSSASLPVLNVASEFIGYEALQGDSEVISLIKLDDDNASAEVDNLKQDMHGIVIVKTTPFYAESGGQVGDVGEIHAGYNIFVVTDTQKQQQAILHYGYVKAGSFKQADKVHLVVNATRRQATRLNHSATHLLHAGLRAVLGEHVMQKGSLVDAERLRFDFSHPKPVTPEQIQALEATVNEQIRANDTISTQLLSYDDALSAGALAFFDDKYGDKVRVLSMGEFSKELCGGTHASATGDIGCFKIISETGIAAGVRRLEAVTGQGALAFINKQAAALTQLKQLLRADDNNIIHKTEQLLTQNRDLDKQLQSLKQQLASLEGDDLVNQALEVNGIKLLAAEVEGLDSKALKSLVDELKTKLNKAIITLACVNAKRITLVSGVTDNLTESYSAGELVNYVSKQVGGKGGGRRDMAQAGGDDVTKLADALASIQTWIEEHK